jgi:hypothetical protein
MTLNGEVVAGLSNWQAVTIVLAVFLLHAAWRWSSTHLRGQVVPQGLSITKRQDPSD